MASKTTPNVALPSLSTTITENTPMKRIWIEIFGKIYDIKDFKWPKPERRWSYSDLEAEHYSLSDDDEDDDYDFY